MDGGGASQFVKEKFGTAWVLMSIVIVLIVAIIALAVGARALYKEDHPKGTFTGAFDMNYGQTNWAYGAGDAGYGGSVTRDTTPIEASIYYKPWQHGYVSKVRRGGGKEGLSTGPGPAMPTTPNMSGQAPANPCGPGQTPIFSSGGDFVYCQSNGSLPEGPAMTCGKNGIGGQWAPEAMAEANALEAVGALSPSVYYGEQRLDRHIGNNPATGASGTGLTEAQLMPLLHSGGAP